MTDSNVSPTYDGADDTLIGVLNNSPNPISSVPLKGTGPVFGFDGDGICSASIKPNPAGCPFGPNGYEGPGVSFGSISADLTQGVANFNPPIPPNGGSGYFGLEVAISTSCTDTDGDGLCDDWEKNGLTVIVNGNPVFLDLPSMGADPNHKDIFVQADYMVDQGICLPLFGCFFGHSHQPKLDAIAAVTQAFANAPLNNPDGKTGVTLHVDCGPMCIMNPKTGQTWGALSKANALPHQQALGNDPNNGYNWSQFDAIKTPNFPQERVQAFHYVVFAHNLGDPNGISGISRGVISGASDFIVSLGSWDNQVGSTQQQAGTFMHELGHNLSHRHGGGDDVNNKPNFLSIMNYTFQMSGLVINGAGGNLDYSRFLLPALDETNLNEAVGLNGGAALGTYGTAYFCAGAANSTQVNNANGAIDWNCNGINNEMGVATDINHDGLRNTLTSFNDWPNTIFNGGSVGELGLAASQPSMTAPQNEITPAIDSTITKPFKVTVSSPGITQVMPGGSANLVFTITNGGTQSDSYTLTANSDQPWADLSGVPTSTALASGANQQITIPVTVPANAAVGSSNNVSIKAVSVGVPNIQDTGIASVAVIGGGPPRLAGSVASKSSSSGTTTVNLLLSNVGSGAAMNASLTGITVRTLGGSGSVIVTAPAVPYNLGNLGVGGSANVTVTLTVPSTVTRFSLAETGTVQDSTGAQHSYSTAEVIQP